MYNSQYYTCEQIDERLLQGYVDDYNTQTGQSLTKEQFLTKLGNVFAKETIIDNTAVNIGYFVCDTAAGTAAKAITAAGYELFQGGSIKVKFTNRNTAGSATLNINSKGAKALYYGGKAVSASNSWDNGEVVEIYYDGTSYYANNVEGNFKDGIFDISAYNLTEGQPTKYDTLAEALGINGNNVPPIFRKGGMQIKYISTYDNKYVQYRLMSDTFNTTVTNWQGVDDVPTVGSDNLVKGGGVTKYAQKSFLSNTGLFNSIFKEFYIANANFDVTQVTSMYIDKAMYRNSDGVYRSQIVLIVGGNEVANFTIDHGTEASALAIFRQNEISQLVDEYMNTVLYCIIDWDTLTTGQRTTFDVSLTKAAAKEQANPSICLYKEVLNNSQTIKFSQLSWRNLSWGGGTSFVDNNWLRLTTEKIQIKQGTKRIYLSAPNSNYKFEMYVFNSSDQKVSAFDNWNAGNAEMVLPNDAAYYIITAAKLNDSKIYEYEFINDNLTAEIKYISSYSLHTLTVGNQNVREFSDEGNSAGGSLDPSTYLPLWKNQMEFLNCDFLTIIEWRDYFDHNDTMNTYNTLLKQFYPYHFEISNNKGLFSKIPCEFERKVRNYEYIIGKTVIDGKSLAVVSWVQGNLDNEEKVRADSQWMINQLVDFDLVVVAGDFNNEQGPQLLQVWLDNGYTLGNCGYWGEISTCIDSAFDHSSNDNIVAKGFIYDKFEKGENRLGSDHYPVIAKLKYYTE